MKPFPVLSRFCLFAAVLSVLVITAVTTARADMIELVNGDHYRGFVIGMTASNVDFLSEIQGRVKLPRDKIAQITLHDVVGKVAAATNQPVPANQTSAALQAAAPVPAQPQPVVVAPLILSGPGGNSAPVASGTAQSVIEQMRQQGVDPKLIQEVQDQIFGKASPAAAAQFNQTVGGLMSGALTVRDIRAQAQSSIAQIKAAKQDLGPDADELLDGYLSVLQQFVNASASDDTITTPQPVAATTK